VVKRVIVPAVAALALAVVVVGAFFWPGFKNGTEAQRPGSGSQHPEGRPRDRGTSGGDKPGFAEEFDGAELDEAKWAVTRKNDFAEFAVDQVPGAAGSKGRRLRLRCGTRGTDDRTVKCLGVVSRGRLDLSGRKKLELVLDWNNQANGCYLTAAVYLCPTLTTGNPAEQPQWLKLEYVGVPPGKNARAAVWFKDQRSPNWLYDEGWPNKQRTGRKIGRVRLGICFDAGRWQVLEDGRLLFDSGGKWRLPFDRAHLYLQMTSHSNYPPRELFFDAVKFGVGKAIPGIPLPKVESF